MNIFRTQSHVHKPDIGYKSKTPCGLSAKLLAGFFTAILVYFFAFFLSENDISKTLILILSGTFIFNAFQIISFDFQAQVKSKYPSIISFLVTLILNVLKIFVIISGKGVIYLAFILLLESVLYAVFYWYFYEKKTEGKIFEWKFNKLTAINLLKDSWPVMFNSAFVVIFSRIDQIFIKNMMDVHSVGIYSSAVTVAEAWYFIPFLIISSLFPAIINAKKTSEELYDARLKKLTILLFWLSTGICILTTILAPLVMQILYGSAFSSGIIILQIYVWSNIGVALSMLASHYLVTENYRKIIIATSFLTMICNVILNIIWIPKYGIVGSAFATLISSFVGLITLMFFKQTREKILTIFKI